MEKKTVLLVCWVGDYLIYYWLHIYGGCVCGWCVVAYKIMFIKKIIIRNVGGLPGGVNETTNIGYPNSTVPIGFDFVLM